MVCAGCKELARVSTKAGQAWHSKRPEVAVGARLGFSDRGSVLAGGTNPSVINRRWGIRARTRKEYDPGLEVKPWCAALTRSVSSPQATVQSSGKRGPINIRPTIAQQQETVANRRLGQTERVLSQTSLRCREKHKGSLAQTTELLTRSPPPVAAQMRVGMREAQRERERERERDTDTHTGTQRERQMRKHK